MMAKEINRATFDALSAADRAAHIKSGGRVTDATAEVARRAGNGEVARAEFDRMTPGERSTALRRGLRVVDIVTLPPFPLKEPPAGFTWARRSIGFVLVPAVLG